MAVPKGSVPGLEVHLPRAEGGVVRIQHPPTHQTWEVQAGALPTELAAAAVWATVMAGWEQRRTHLDGAGERLGQWLFGLVGGEALRVCESGWQSDGQPRRIALHVPDELAAWPWELLSHEQFGPLAVHKAFTLYRVASSEQPALKEPDSLPRLQLIGVKLDHTQAPGLDDLETDSEVRTVHELLSAPGRAGQIWMMPPDPLGEWNAVRKRIGEMVPDIFHFAGHGTADGRSLVFRGARGEAVTVDALQLVGLLTGQRTGRCRLAVLNACFTAATHDRRAQPFGSLAHRLSELGIPYVVGIQVPLVDEEGQLFAATFYEELARGRGVDEAVQAARRELMMNGGGHIAWGLISLVVKGPPAPVVRPWDAPALNLDADLDAFAFRTQRNALDEFLRGSRSMVVVAHGRDRSGHRYVIERVKRDLEQRRVLWTPVSTMRWAAVEQGPELVRQLLLANLAEACGLDTDGSVDELRARLTACIRSRSASKVLVVDVEEVIAPGTPGEADAIVQLVREVWTEVVRDVGQGTTFLLLSLMYLPDDQPELRALAASVVDRLRAQPKLIPGRLRVEVLDELAPITVAEVARFIERAYDVDEAVATKQAETLVRRFDNERILENLRDFIKKSRRGPAATGRPAAAAPALRPQGGP